MRYLVSVSFENWKTTLGGIAVILTTIASIVTHGADIFNSTIGIISGIALILAKDA